MPQWGLAALRGSAPRLVKTLCPRIAFKEAFVLILRVLLEFPVLFDEIQLTMWGSIDYVGRQGLSENWMFARTPKALI